jgi:hypothetical protein
VRQFVAEEGQLARRQIRRQNGIHANRPRVPACGPEEVLHVAATLLSALAHLETVILDVGIAHKVPQIGQRGLGGVLPPVQERLVVSADDEEGAIGRPAGNDHGGLIGKDVGEDLEVYRVRVLLILR